jgi:hypothetical protein
MVVDLETRIVEQNMQQKAGNLCRKSHNGKKKHQISSDNYPAKPNTKSEGNRITTQKHEAS